MPMPMSRIYSALSGAAMQCGYDLHLSQTCTKSLTEPSPLLRKYSKTPNKRVGCRGVQQSLLGRDERPWKRPAMERDNSHLRHDRTELIQ